MQDFGPNLSGTRQAITDNFIMQFYFAMLLAGYVITSLFWKNSFVKLYTFCGLLKYATMAIFYI